MWQKLADCGKQLNINFRVRQTIEDTDLYVTEYLVTEIEFDQYELQLTTKTKNGQVVNADHAEVLDFSCRELLKYKFEVWTEVSN